MLSNKDVYQYLLKIRINEDIIEEIIRQRNKTYNDMKQDFLTKANKCLECVLKNYNKEYII